jgi:hypothetical protein
MAEFPFPAKLEYSELIAEHPSHIEGFLEAKEKTEPPV